MLKRIISGGQTGADQASLDVAIKHNIPHGGAIPKGRLTEDGLLSETYHLEEMTTNSYPKRTEKNVIDSDGTVIFTHGKLTGGSLLTRKKAIEHNKPVLHLDMIIHDVEGAAIMLHQFIKENSIEVLNVAGSRASKDERIYAATFSVTERLVLTPTTIVTSGNLWPVFSSDATNRSGDFDAESTPPVQWPFLYRTLSAASPFLKVA